jgi:ribose transport system permease protein
VEAVKNKVRKGFELNWNQTKGVILPLITLLLLITVFSLMSPAFFSAGNLVNLLRQMSILLIVALAGTVVILIGSIDLSVGAVVTLSGTIAAFTVPYLGAGALLVGMAIGMMAGFMSGIIFTAFKIPSFLATLGMMSALTGIANYLSDGRPILFKSASFDYLTKGTFIPGIPNIFLWSVLCFIIIVFISFRTVFGRNMFAIGGGEKVAQLSGIKVNRLKIYVFMISGLLCGLAGTLLASRIGAGTPRMGDPLLLDSIAAVVMGGTALSGGVGGSHRTIVGVLVITVLSNGLNITGVHPFLQEIVKGLVVIAAVAATMDRSKFELTK